MKRNGTNSDPTMRNPTKSVIDMADVAGESDEVKRHHRTMIRNNKKPSPYPADGTPADAFCKPGQYDSMTKGKYYNAKSGPDRWDAKQKGGKVY